MKQKYYTIPYKIKDLHELFYMSTEKNSNRIIVEQFLGGEIQRYTYEKFKKDVLALSAFLLENNLSHTYIILSGEMNYLWIVSYFSIIISHSKVVCIDKNILISDEIYDIMKNIQISCVISDEELSGWFTGVMEFSYDEIYTVLSSYRGKDLNQNSKGLINPLEEIAVVLFTSGTTGKIKPVYLTHENLAQNTMGCQMLMGRSSNDKLLFFF